VSLITDWLCRRRHHPLTRGGPTLRSCPCGTVWHIDADDPTAVDVLRIRARNEPDPNVKGFLLGAADHIESQEAQ